MSAPIPTRTLDCARFATCVDAVARRFAKRNGRMSRASFKQICLQHSYSPALIQAYFEAAGLRVERVTNWKQADSDQYVWNMCKEAPGEWEPEAVA